MWRSVFAKERFLAKRSFADPSLIVRCDLLVGGLLYLGGRFSVLVEPFGIDSPRFLEKTLRLGHALHCALRVACQGWSSRTPTGTILQSPENPAYSSFTV